LVIDGARRARAEDSDSLEEAALPRTIRPDEDIDLAEVDTHVLERLEVLNRDVGEVTKTFIPAG